LNVCEVSTGAVVTVVGGMVTVVGGMVGGTLVLVLDCSCGMVKDTGGARAKRAVGANASMTAIVVPPARMTVAASLYVHSLCPSLVLTGVFRIGSFVAFP
jgi:hypothetical protein